jgi:hypothetical protein
MEGVLAWIVQTLASSVVAILAFVAIKSTAFGERVLDHHLAKKIEDLRHQHVRELEALRADLAHVLDRGRRANELEFEAVTKVWNAFVDAWIKTQQAIVDQKSFPDLNSLSDSDLSVFLESTELSGQQRQQVLGAKDKTEMYSKILSLRTINTAGAAIYDGRQMLRTNGIFISASVAKSFKDAFEELSGAQVERYMEFQHRRSAGYEKSMAVLDPSGHGLIATLESLVRTTIRRD